MFTLTAQRRHGRTRYDDDVSDDKRWMGRRIDSTHERRQVQLVTQCYQDRFVVKTPREGKYFTSAKYRHISHNSIHLFIWLGANLAESRSAKSLVLPPHTFMPHCRMWRRALGALAPCKCIMEREVHPGGCVCACSVDSGLVCGG